MILHDIIQKNMEEFDEKFHPGNGYELLLKSPNHFQMYDVTFGIKNHLLSSQLSIIQAIDEWAGDNKIKDIPENWLTGYNRLHTEDIRHNRTLSELRSFLEEAKSKLQ